MTDRAFVDALRALPAPVAMRVLDALEAELGPEATAALGSAWEFWRRPAQRFPSAHEHASIVVYSGGYGAGKTRTAWELLVHRILTGRAISPRILAATGAAARSLVTHRRTGILAWTKPGVTYEWEPSKGFEGRLTINGTPIELLSIDAPRTALGEGADVQLLDDPPKWGPTGIDALKAALKSARERGTETIVPTTDDGLVLLRDVLGDDLEAAGVLVIDLGLSEENAGNLDPAYFRTKAAMEQAGTWNPLGSSSPWARLSPEQWRAMRVDLVPRFVEACVSLDPHKGGATKPCEFGVIGGGRDARSVIYTTHDRSAVLDAGLDGWPSASWDVAVELQRAHPGAPWHFLFESNVGKERAELLRAEEMRRRRNGLPVPLPGGGWADAANRSEVSVCDVRWIRADRDKCKRAEMPAALAAQGRVRHVEGLAKLEGQQRNLTPAGTDSDRADAENHMIADLAGLRDATQPDRTAQAQQAARGLADLNRRIRAPAIPGGLV